MFRQSHREVVCYRYLFYMFTVVESLKLANI